MSLDGGRVMEMLCYCIRSFNGVKQSWFVKHQFTANYYVFRCDFGLVALSPNKLTHTSRTVYCQILADDICRANIALQLRSSILTRRGDPSQILAYMLPGDIQRDCLIFF